MARIHNESRLSIWRPIQPQSVFVDEYTNVMSAQTRIPEKKAVALTARLKGANGFNQKIVNEDLEKEIKQGRKILMRLLVSAFIILNVYMVGLFFKTYDVQQMRNDRVLDNFYYSTKSALFSNWEKFKEFSRLSIMPKSFWKD